MKTRFFSIVLLSFVLILVDKQLYAQAKFPPPSSAQKITQGLGISEIDLAYSRPSARGRVIFGDLVPYGEVWRTGANTVTSISFPEEVSIEGRTVPAGTYGLLSIPTAGEWTIILSSNSTQWGAYSYKEEEDVLRFTVPSVPLAAPVETFTILFSDVTNNSVKLNILWETTSVAFTISADQSAAIEASIEEALAGDGERKPYFQAAQYYYSNDKDITKAVEWINEADKGNTRAPHIKYWKARILLKSGDKAGAVAAAREGVTMAEAANNAEYIKLNQQVITEAGQ